jgi:transcriptional regulator with XRE-family HTH domain
VATTEQGSNGTADEPTGQIIHDRRVFLDLSKNEAARRAGVSRRTWHEIEEGRRLRVSELTLRQIDQILGFEEGTLWATMKPANQPSIEALRTEAIGLLRMMTAPELRDFIEDCQGTSTLRAEVAAMRAELAVIMARLGHDVVRGGDVSAVGE